MQKDEKKPDEKPDEKPVQKIESVQETKTPEVKPKAVKKPAKPKVAPVKENKGKTFDEIFPDIELGKHVTLDEQPGFYFKFESGRLRKFSDNGAYIDSSPLYTFQVFKGWRVKE